MLRQCMRSSVSTKISGYLIGVRVSITHEGAVVKLFQRLIAFVECSFGKYKY